MYSRRIALAALLSRAVLRSDPRGPFFHQVLRSGARTKVLNDNGFSFAAVRIVRAGMVKLPTGKLVSSSVMDLNQARSLPVKVKPGSYSVELVMIDSAEQGPIVSAAFVRLAASQCADKAAGWEVADCGVDRPGCPFQSYGNNACFADSEAISLWKELRKSPADQNQVLTELEAGIAQNRTAQRADFGESILTDDSAVNLIAYKPGKSDGQIMNWLGLNSAGQVTTVLVDFGLHDATVFPYGRPPI